MDDAAREVVEGTMVTRVVVVSDWKKTFSEVVVELVEGGGWKVELVEGGSNRSVDFGVAIMSLRAVGAEEVGVEEEGVEEVEEDEGVEE